MALESYQVYRHSGKWSPHGPALLLAATLLAGFPLGFAYAYLMKWIPFIFLRVCGTAGYGLVLGFVSLYLLKLGKVRNTSIATISGVLAGMVGLYFAWNGYLHTLVDHAPILVAPGQLLMAMQHLYEIGSWSLKGSGNVTGIPLAIVWAVEGLMVVGISALIPAGVIMDTPFCESSQCWLDDEKKISTLAPFADPEHLAAFQRGELAPLLRAQPRVTDSPSFVRLVLKRSPRSQVFSTVRVESVVTRKDARGNNQETTTRLTENLIIPSTMREVIEKFEKFAEAEVTTPESKAA